MKRLFIAINLPDEVKNKIDKIIKGSNGDFRWIPPKNWHLTLVFLGNQPDGAIIPILESIKEIVKNFPAPMIEFEKIILAPPNKPPRMIWLTGPREISKILGEIKINLENSLIENGVRFKIENRPFNSHLTLCRFPNQSLISFANIREFNSRLIRDLNFTPQSIDLMESRLKRTGAEYETLTKFDFTK